MAAILILIFVESIALACAYAFFRDILSPSVISILTILVSTLMCIPMLEAWEMQLQYTTIMVIGIGLVSMIIGDRFFAVKKKSSLSISAVKLKYSEIKASFWICICVILTVYYCLAVIKAGSLGGARNALDAITVAKHFEEDDIQVDFIAKQGVKIVFALSYLHLFIFITNINHKKGVKNNIKHIIPAVCTITCCLFTGVRTDMLKIIAAAIFMVIVFRRNSFTFKKKIFVRTIIGLFIFAYLGSSLNSLFKGEDANINVGYSPTQIIAYYIGSPIQMLNLKINNGIEKYRDKKIWGRTTFSRQYLDLEKFGIWESGIKNNIGSTFLIIDSKYLIAANVDTILGPPLYDFGIFGMIIYIIILYALMSWFYYKKTYGNYSQYLVNLFVIINSFFFVIPLMAYYACLPNLILKFSYFVQVVLIIIFYNHYFNSSINYKIRVVK